jgi:hypothetical protein
MKKILAIDGGGMRGYMPAAILAELERRADKPCAEIFDVMAGTSVGGITVGGLGSGQSAAAMLKFFTEDGPAIFGSPQEFGECGIDKPRFAADTIESCLMRRLGLGALGDVKAKILMPAFDLTINKLTLFKSYAPGTAKLWQAARATSAAPSYFPAATIGGLVLWDGGVMANNPAGLALADAISIWGPEEDYQVLAIGTGAVIETAGGAAAAQNLINAGLVPIASRLLEALFASTSQVTDYEMAASLGLGYHRVQPILPTLFNLADARPAAVAALEAAAAEAITKFSATLDSFSC